MGLVLRLAGSWISGTLLSTWYLVAQIQSTILSSRSKQKGRHYQVDEQNAANWIKRKSDRELTVSDDEPFFPTAEGETTIARARDFTWKLFEKPDESKASFYLNT